MQAWGDDDLYGGQSSSEVKYNKLWHVATKHGQKNPWWKIIMMMEVKGHFYCQILLRLLTARLLPKVYTLKNTWSIMHRLENDPFSDLFLSKITIKELFFSEKGQKKGIFLVGA